MLYDTDHFLSISADGLLYLKAFLPHATMVAFGQLTVSSHRLEIEVGRASHIPREERICKLCNTEVESEEHYVCRCPAYRGIREGYSSLFSEHLTLEQLLQTSNQRILGTFLLDIQHHKERALQEMTTTGGDLQ